jgi:hypothetical protein
MTRRIQQLAAAPTGAGHSAPRRSRHHAGRRRGRRRPMGGRLPASGWTAPSAPAACPRRLSPPAANTASPSSPARSGSAATVALCNRHDEEQVRSPTVLLIDGSSAPRRPAAGGMLRCNRPVAGLSVWRPAGAAGVWMDDSPIRPWLGARRGGTAPRRGRRARRCRLRCARRSRCSRGPRSRRGRGRGPPGRRLG